MFSLNQTFTSVLDSREWSSKILNIEEVDTYISDPKLYISAIDQYDDIAQGNSLNCVICEEH